MSAVSWSWRSLTVFKSWTLTSSLDEAEAEAETTTGTTAASEEATEATTATGTEAEAVASFFLDTLTAGAETGAETGAGVGVVAGVVTGVLATFVDFTGLATVLILEVSEELIEDMERGIIVCTTIKVRQVWVRNPKSSVLFGVF